MTLNGEIYTVEIGKIKRLCNDGVFVYYHTGETAVKTNYKDLYKIENGICIRKFRRAKKWKKEKTRIIRKEIVYTVF